MNKLVNVKNKLKNRKGFTLVELIIVMVILAILAALLIPTMMGYIREARNSNSLSAARGYYVAAQSVGTDLSATDTTVTVAEIVVNNKWANLIEGLPTATVSAAAIGGGQTGTTALVGIIMHDGATGPNGAVSELFYYSGNPDNDIVHMEFPTNGQSTVKYIPN